MIPMSCDLNEGPTVVFDVPDPTADDLDSTSWLFDLLVGTVGK